MNDWVQLTISDGHFLDEITAALRDAKIELRLVEPVTATAADDPGLHTWFGQRGKGAKVIEVPSDKIADAQAILQEIYAGASEAAERESGAAPATAEEREEERVWRAEIERKRERSARITSLMVRGFFGAIMLAIVIGVVYRYFVAGRN
jgi:hypothetical protein